MYRVIDSIRRISSEPKIRRRKNVFIALLFAVVIFVVCAPLLRPGYLLTLDLIWGPNLPLKSGSVDGFFNDLPIYSILYLLNKPITAWFLQKLLLLSLFSALLFFPYRFLLPNVSSRTRFIVALFYFLNPFVYTRFLAGQWMILCAYAFLPLVFFLAKRVVEGVRWSGIRLAFTLVVMCAFSLHIGFMGIVVACASALIAWPSRTRHALKQGVLALGAFLLGMTYWTIPALTRHEGSLLTIFDERHLLAFRTSTHPILGTWGNVLALGGFWGEREPWSRAFVWPWEAHPVIMGIAAGLLMSVILFGMYITIRARDTRRMGVLLFIVGCLAFIFSCGVGDTIFASFNHFLFSHVSFWSGFRDSQKWTALLVLVYAFFFGQGIERWRFVYVTLIPVLVFTYPMLFGFWGQLKPVWYPTSWYHVDEILKADPNCTVIFLPWHGYFQMKFNHDVLTANPARNFFHCQIIESRQVEIGGITSQGLTDPAYDAIEGLVTGRDGLSRQAVQAILDERKVGYILFAQDLVGRDPLKYEFLEDLGWEKVSLEGLTIYRRAH